MNKKIRVSSLSRLFGIEQESWDDYPYEPVKKSL